ncbi:hypothetical protein FZC84_06695 [Rossellomorea vietnamensis]|uniref:Uncharacterized protein n=1 Tax=Rossellomorea vietnamensis TaxID=218284 RepID=A0A5D4MFK8_9BACI|nr:hypothetical protein [Rossellomorea vietnamensis]TYS00229.1 hypothetical protein FZC84_06695 [Rossellomorea vietnamensis]
MREDVLKAVSWIHEVVEKAEEMYPKQPLGYMNSWLRRRRCIQASLLGTRTRGEGEEDVSKLASWVHEVVEKEEKMYPS